MQVFSLFQRDLCGYSVRVKTQNVFSHNHPYDQHYLSVSPPAICLVWVFLQEVGQNQIAHSLSNLILGFSFPSLINSHRIDRLGELELTKWNLLAGNCVQGARRECVCVCVCVCVACWFYLPSHSFSLFSVPEVHQGWDCRVNCPKLSSFLPADTGHIPTV